MPESNFVKPMSHLEGNVCSVVGHIAGRGIIGLPVLMVLSTLGLLGRLLSPLLLTRRVSCWPSILT